MKIFLTLCLFINLTFAQGSIKNEDLPKVEAGKQVIYKENVNASPWPKLHIYQLIDATPLESLAIFLALDHQKNYLPNLLKSDPVKHMSPTQVYTKYELELPWPLSNSHYTHASDFKKVNDNEFEASWWMVTSESAESVNGSASFKQYKGKTLMGYHSFVKPKSFLAGLVKSSMIEDTLASIKSVQTETQRVKKEDQKLLKKYTDIIKNSLNGKNAYQEIIQTLSSEQRK
ncbi:hypothetical protein BIY24_05720 [Halobacteriovorax marinus]|uniref:hypothetical protein n=1 Tax=Halobacteriovorax marinus TaxID=97084 RepID=UPI000BC349CA|nr:hypothetical protein [Halobacteriovorax marinus]ATH07457.1 hypothetical protein BIY24_05720 [Halobacteriovorax marinus]